MSNYNWRMRRRFSLARLFVVLVMVLAVLSGVRAAPPTVGMASMDCATTGHQAPPAKEPCSPDNSGCIVASRCAVGCVAEVPLQAASASLPATASQGRYRRDGGMAMGSHSLQPDPYPPRSPV